MVQKIPVGVMTSSRDQGVALGESRDTRLYLSRYRIPGERMVVGNRDRRDNLANNPFTEASGSFVQLQLPARETSRDASSTKQGKRNIYAESSYKPASVVDGRKKHLSQMVGCRRLAKCSIRRNTLSKCMKRFSNCHKSKRSRERNAFLVKIGEWRRNIPVQSVKHLIGSTVV